MEMPHNRLTLLVFTLLLILLRASATLSKFQTECTMCSSCDNPCQVYSPPPPPPPSNIYPPPAQYGYYPPPSGYVYPPPYHYHRGPTPPPPNPIVQYFPFYHHNPPPGNNAMQLKSFSFAYSLLIILFRYFF